MIFNEKHSGSYPYSVTYSGFSNTITTFRKDCSNIVEMERAQVQALIYYFFFIYMLILVFRNCIVLSRHRSDIALCLPEVVLRSYILQITKIKNSGKLIKCRCILLNKNNTNKCTYFKIKSYVKSLVIMTLSKFCMSPFGSSFSAGFTRSFPHCCSNVRYWKMK